MPEFLEILKEVIGGMKVRSFERLRKIIIPIIGEIHKKSNREFKENIFSKHYWSDFKKKHLEIQEIWRKLPRVKGKKLLDAYSKSNLPSAEEDLQSARERLFSNINLKFKINVDGEKVEQTENSHTTPMVDSSKETKKEGSIRRKWKSYKSQYLTSKGGRCCRCQKYRDH